MSKLSIYMSNLQKVRMDYLSHGIYRGSHFVFSLFSLSLLRISSGQVQNYQLFVRFAGFSQLY